MNNRCPACGSQESHVFYSIDRIPVHSVRLIWSRDEAVHFQKWKIDMSHCRHCGFIWNASYDPELQDYSDEYESTQAFSPTFNAFAGRLAQELIDRYDLHHKRLIEIGCGQGEFISQLCDLGENEGLGFDPAFDHDRAAVTDSGRVEIIPDYYSEKYTNIQADFVCCKMTLEHIGNVSEFIGMVRRAVGDHKDTTVFFQVPNIVRILKEVAFWDIYYEHCSYFSLGSIARLFRQEKFDVQRLWTDYGDQYLMIEARPADSPTQPRLPEENDLETIAHLVDEFSQRIPHELEQWKQTVQNAYHHGQKTVLWGSGSKGVAFLTTLGLCDEIEYTVDVNPNKHGTFMAGTGQKVVPPEFMGEYKPNLVILMNPLYRKDITEDLGGRGVSPKILSVGE